MPIEELEERIKVKCAAAEPEIRHMAEQAGALSLITEPLDPASIKRGQRDGGRQHPKTQVDRERND